MWAALPEHGVCALCYDRADEPGYMRCTGYARLAV